MSKDAKIYIAGHTGLVGSAIVRQLQSQGYTNIITKTHEQLDLTREDKVEIFFAIERPKYVFVCAAKVGGIYANNTYPVDFIMTNVQISTNLIKYAHKFNVQKLLYLGSSCIYPKNCQQPIKEEYLLSGALESTNEPYAIAKIMGIKMCQAYNKQYSTNYITAMPCSLFGQEDNFNPNNSHLIPGIIQRMHNAKINNIDTVEIWGSGKPLREFMYVDDMANACVFLMNNYNENEIINVGIGKDLTIRDIAHMIKDVVGYNGNLYFDESKPDGTFRKVLDTSKLNDLGWKSQIKFKDGLKMIYDWYLQNKASK
jgi:GDP-L-fucose synthase